MVKEVMDNQDLALTMVHCAGLAIQGGVEHYDTMIFDESGSSGR